MQLETKDCDRFSVMSTRFKPGLVSITFRELSIKQIVAIVAEAGLKGIEWGGDVQVPHGDLSIAETAKRLTLEAGLEVSAYGSYYRFDDCDANAEEKGPDIEAVLDSAEALGAPTIRVWVGRKGSAEASDNWRQAVIERTQEIAEKAAARGMRIDFEYHSNTLTDTSESTRRLLEEIAHPAVGTFWQPPLLMSHEDRLAGLKSVISRVTNIHCNFFGQNDWPNRLALSEGEADWSDYLRALEENGREHWISIEHVKDDSVESFKKDAATLVQWLSAMA